MTQTGLAGPGFWTQLHLLGATCPGTSYSRSLKLVLMGEMGSRLLQKVAMGLNVNARPPKNLYMTFTVASFTVAKKWKPKCPLTDEMNKQNMVYPLMGYCSAIKRNEIETHAPTGMNMILSGRSRSVRKAHVV